MQPKNRNPVKHLIIKIRFHKILKQVKANTHALVMVFILSIILFAVLIIDISKTKTKIQVDSTKDIDNIPTQDQPQFTSNENFSDWKTYTNNKYGFEFKYPPSKPLEKRTTEDTNQQYVTVNNGYDYIAIYPEFKGIGFEDQNTTTTSEPLIIADHQLTIADNKIEKIRITTTHPTITETWFLIFIPYPEKRDYSISVKYGFLNGSANENSEKLFDQIVSTIKFFDPGENSTLTQTGITNFSSKLLKLSFKYPSDWGQIEEALLPGETGKSYNLSFDGNVGGSALGFGSIMAGGRSKDYSEGRGGYVVDAANGFSGSKEFCSSFYGKQGTNCDLVNQNTISQLVVPKYVDFCSTDPNLPPNKYWFSKRVWVNLTGQEIDGFMMQYSNFWTNDFIEMSSPDLDCSTTTQLKFDNMVAQIVNKINSGDVDPKTRSNLEGFDSLVRSIKLID